MAFGSLPVEIQEKYDINAPELPCKRKAPAHFEIDSSHVARAFLHVKTYLRSTMTHVGTKKLAMQDLVLII